MSELLKWVAAICACIFFLVVIFFTSGWVYAHYRLWRVEYTGRALEIEKRYKGKAVLAEAENARKARIEAARAEKEAAQLTADAIKVVGQAAKDYPEYRQQEFYLALGDALHEGKIQQIIYLPTEAGLPITEARERVSATQGED
jgi:hypothetical protein